MHISYIRDCQHRLAPICLILIQIQFIRNCTVQALHSCWSYNDKTCIIRTVLHQFTNNGDNITLEIDCGSFQNNDSTHLARSVNKTNNLHNHLFEHAQNITLNGCHTPLNAPPAYGLPFVPYCNKFQQITIEKFHDNDLQELYCLNPIQGSHAFKNESESEIKTVRLYFRRNELGGIAANSLSHFNNLQELYFESNNLRHIHHQAFKKLHALNTIVIKNEAQLTIMDTDLFKNTSVSYIHMYALRSIAPEFFKNLPTATRSIILVKTPIEGNALEIISSPALQNISIIDCGVSSFYLSNCAASAKYINLSCNSIVNFSLNLSNQSEEVPENSNFNKCALEILDLSGNKLTCFPLNWLYNLGNLRSIILSANYLKTIEIIDLVTVAPLLQYIDLRENQLTSFAEPFLQTECDNIRIRIDRNPWNCIWLFNFAHAHPDRFGIFQYDKYISKINVNGLECQPENRAPEKIVMTTEMPVQNVNNDRRQNFNTEGVLGKFAPKIKSPPMNMSSYKLIYGPPWDLKRSQKAEALIIVFLLPVGIAFLFLLLYMWIHCQKIFHLSFYRALSCSHRNETACNLNIIETAASFNYPNNNDGYETPLKDVTMCDCKLTTIESAADRCHEIHYVTYEPVPSEPSSKLYEEIYEDVNERNDL